MSNLFSGISGRFRGSGRKSPGPQYGIAQSTPPIGNSVSGSNSPTNVAPRMPPLQSPSSLSSAMSIDDTNNASSSFNGDVFSHYGISKPLPLWLNNYYVKHIVRGNFMTLCVRPKTVEPGEWLAHQVVEHFRILWNFVRVIYNKDVGGHALCNAQSCPSVSTEGVPFTWLSLKKEIPAHEYITMMQRYISEKIDDVEIFPTDAAGVSFAHNPAGPEIAAATYASGSLTPNEQQQPIPAGPTNLNATLAQLIGPGEWVGKSSGFPKEFVDICQTMFRQIFQVYTHLYWSHFSKSFYKMELDKHLNSCMSHFLLTATEIDMLKPHELEPMKPLIDLGAANGTFPPESKAYACANVQAGQLLLAMAGPN